MTNPTSSIVLIPPSSSSPHVNGKGIERELTPSQMLYVFPSSGVKVIVEKVSRQRSADHYNSTVRKNEHLKPVVPTQVVNIAGEDVSSPNPSDPDYLRALTEYESTINSLEMEWFISQCMKYDEHLVSEYRALSLERDGTDYSEHPDWFIFLYHLAALDPSDISGLYSIALSLSSPTPAAIADAKSRF